MNDFKSGPSTTGPSTKSRRRIVVAIVVAAVLVAGAVGAVVVLRDDEPTARSTTTTSSSTATVPLPSTAPPVPTTIRSVAGSSAVWPYVNSTTRYHSPESAAKAFATEFLLFNDPRMGIFQQGDNRSGELAVRPAQQGPLTTVLLRQLEDDNWWVLGASTPNIQISQPVAMTSISSPVRMSGTSTSFEANVQTEIRQDGTTTPLAEGYVMGGSMGDFAPFDATLNFPRPTATAGALVLFTTSAENGQVWEASVVRIMFAQ